MTPKEPSPLAVETTEKVRIAYYDKDAYNPYPWQHEIPVIIESALTQAVTATKGKLIAEVATPQPDCGHRAGCQYLGDETRGENPAEVYCAACVARAEGRERLRSTDIPALCDAVEVQAAEIERLRAALREIAFVLITPAGETMRFVARAALEKEKP